MSVNTAVPTVLKLSLPGTRSAARHRPRCGSGFGLTPTFRRPVWGLTRLCGCPTFTICV